MLTPSKPPPKIHGVVSVLCVFMILWVAILPGSWKGMISKDAAQQQEDVIPSFLPLQKNITSKFATHPAVHALHILPSMIWAGVIPLQLNQGFRKKHRTVHRTCGSLLMCSVVAMTCGYILMDRRGLIQGTGGPHESPSQTWLLRIVISWFAFTAAKAASLAIQGKYSSHRVWVYRHIASGIWVAVQRLFLFAFGVFHVTGLVDWRKEGNKVAGFENAGLLAYVLCVGWCELVVLRDLRREKLKGESEKVLSKND